MPEGPEVRNTGDKLAQALEGLPVTEIYFEFEKLRPFAAKLAGQTVAAVETRGKATLIRFRNRLNIYSHNHLFGKWRVSSAGVYPKTESKLRLAIHNPEHSAFLYSASSIEVLKDSELEHHSYLSKLGPDLLAPDITEKFVLARFRDTRFSNRTLAALLLDQSFLAGPGNYLRSEILFIARLHPSLKLGQCSVAQTRKLAQAALTITRRAYQYHTVTVDPALVAKLKKQGLKRGAYRHYVFAREGKPCFICNTAIIKEMYGGRRLYICPRCQASETSQTTLDMVAKR